MKIFPSLALLAACSTNPLDPGAGSQAGAGTQTLLVNGSVRAEPNTPNTNVATEFTSQIDIDISLNGQPVTTGLVRVKSRSGQTDLTFDQPNNGAGRWIGTLASYDEVYDFDIEAGPDKVYGVYVDGPDIQTFATPTAGAALDVTVANTTTWRRESPAQDARLGVGDANTIVPDTGNYSIPPMTLRYDKSQPRDNTLRLVRTNRVTPKGGVAGSELSVSVAQELDVIALACPTCP